MNMYKYMCIRVYVRERERDMGMVDLCITKDACSGQQENIRLQHTATNCNNKCNTVQHATTRCDTLQHTPTHCNTMQHNATQCSTMQHTATQQKKYGPVSIALSKRSITQSNSVTFSR